MAFIEPMHRNKPNITYLLTYLIHWLLLDVGQAKPSVRQAWECIYWTRVLGL